MATAVSKDLKAATSGGKVCPRTPDVLVVAGAALQPPKERPCLHKHICPLSPSCCVALPCIRLWRPMGTQSRPSRSTRRVCRPSTTPATVRPDPRPRVENNTQGSLHKHDYSRTTIVVDTEVGLPAQDKRGPTRICLGQSEVGEKRTQNPRKSSMAVHYSRDLRRVKTNVAGRRKWGWCLELPQSPEQYHPPPLYPIRKGRRTTFEPSPAGGPQGSQARRQHFPPNLPVTHQNPDKMQHRTHKRETTEFCI